MKNNIENTARSYQDLIDEVEQEQAKMLEELKYVLTGVVAGREPSEQEYQCFYDRSIYKTYYNRAIKKLSKQATLIKHLLRRK